MKKIVCALSVCLLAAGAANADLIAASTDDAQISAGANDQGSAPFTVDSSGTPMRAGRSGGLNWTAVIPFQLPNLGAVADPFLTGSLTINLAGNTENYNADLYGLDSRVDSTVLAADFYMGSADGESDVTFLQNSFLTTGTGARTSDDFATWLNAQYDSGAGVGEYVFLRVSADVNSATFPPANGFTITSANAGSGQPFVTYTAIPEPATSGLLGLGALVALLIRRRQRG